MALPDYLQDTSKDFAKQLTAATSVPINTSTFTGRQFVAGEDPMQTQAVNLATSGIGSYQPFLTAAQGAIGQQTASTGPQAFQQFMSPYQQQVIDTTMSDFDRQAAMGRQGIRDQAAVSGAFGGGREGVQMAEYGAGSDRNRASLLAQLQQQGFTQAQNLAQQNFQNQGTIAGLQSGLAGQQYGLSNFQRQSMGADVSALGSLGALRQGQQQALLSADQQAAQTGAYEPYGRLSQYGNTLTGLAGGVSGQQYAEPQAASPFSTALTTALGVGGLYGKIFK